MNEGSLVEVAKAIIPAVAAVALAWAVGNRLSAKWGLWQKRREQAQAAANEFYRLYGEFFAVWKLWNYSVRQADDDKTWNERRWELLKRAAAAEAGVESLLVKVSAERSLVVKETATLGRFRQGYQRLRQTIRDGETLNWRGSEHPEYLAFKQLASDVSGLVSSVDLGTPPSSEDARRALEAITSNRWENRWYDSRGQ